MSMDPLQFNYRACFDSASGKEVLANILILGGYFDSEMKTTEDLAVLNFVKKIMKNCGFHPEDVSDGAVVGSYVGKLFDIPLRNK